MNEKVVWPVLFGGRIENADAITGGVGLTAAGTSLSSSALAAMPVVDTTNHAYLILDPVGEFGAPEPVLVTTHTAGNPLATVTRGVTIPGFTGVARPHPRGVFFVASTLPGIHVPRKTVDQAWGGDTLAGGPFDYEFDEDTTSLPAGWSWVNQGASTYTEEFGAGRIEVPAGSSNNWRIIDRAMPAASAWTMTAKFAFNGTLDNDGWPALLVRDSSAGTIATIGPRYDGSGVIKLETSTWSSPTGTRTAIGAQRNWPAADGRFYARIRKNSSTSWDFQVSVDGRYWFPMTAANNITGAVATPDRIGFGLNCTSNLAASLSCEWMRVR